MSAATTVSTGTFVNKFKVGIFPLQLLMGDDQLKLVLCAYKMAMATGGFQRDFADKMGRNVISIGPLRSCVTVRKYQCQFQDFKFIDMLILKDFSQIMNLYILFTLIIKFFFLNSKLIYEY